MILAIIFSDDPSKNKAKEQKQLPISYNKSSFSSDLNHFLLAGISATTEKALSISSMIPSISFHIKRPDCIIPFLIAANRTIKRIMYQGFSIPKVDVNAFMKLVYNSVYQNIGSLFVSIHNLSCSSLRAMNCVREASTSLVRFCVKNMVDCITRFIWFFFNCDSPLYKFMKNVIIFTMYNLNSHINKLWQLFSLHYNEFKTKKIEFELSNLIQILCSFIKLFRFDILKP